MKDWNENEEIQFTVQLGDIIDGNETEEATERDMQEVMAVIAQARHPMYHVIGNHCNNYNGGREKVMEKLGMPSGPAWYSFLPQQSKAVRECGHVFLVLDGTDVSVNKWNPTDPKSLEAEAWLEAHTVEEYARAVPWNGAIGQEQLAWLEAELVNARETAKRVFIFCHYPILADHLVMDISLLWNAPEVVALLDRYDDVVVAWFSGHYHRGGAQMPSPSRKWAHLTIEAILMAPEQSYGIVDVHENGISLKGTGSCTSHSWVYPRV